MMPEHAKTFAEEWISAWNKHDIKALLSRCADDFEMSSPLVADAGADASGTIRGREAVGEYWTRTLVRAPTLRFDLVDVLTGAHSIIVLFRTNSGRMAAQFLEFGAEGKIVRGAAHFSL